MFPELLRSGVGVFPRRSRGISGVWGSSGTRGPGTAPRRGHPPGLALQGTRSGLRGKVPEVLLAGSSAGLSLRLGPRRIRGGSAGLRGVCGAGDNARGAQISALSAALWFGHGRVYCVISDNNYSRSAAPDTSGE